MKLPEKATHPTIYFIGVTTAKSSIMNIFPLWAQELGLENARIKGIDIEIHAKAEKYRQCVTFIKNDEQSLGALVTTHKIDLYHAAHDLFDELDCFAQMFHELSCISKKNGRLKGSAKDPISSGLAIKSFIPNGFWKKNSGEVFIMGAGGSALAISAYLVKKEHGLNVPSKIIISNRSKQRLESAKKLLSHLNSDVTFEFHLCPDPKDNDKILASLPPYSLVVNATGLGKDRPGSPLTESCKFPENSFVWELNYRGELTFMHQAISQKEMRNLHVEDGWVYFIHGWTQVIAEVFQVNIDKKQLEKLSRIALEQRKNR